MSSTSDEENDWIRKAEDELSDGSNWVQTETFVERVNRHIARQAQNQADQDVLGVLSGLRIS